MPDTYPLYLPTEARRLFQAESLLRRFAQAAHWTKASNLLELHGSLGGLALCKALSCRLTVVEPELKVAETLKERGKVAGLGDRVTFLHKPTRTLDFAEESFDGIFALGRVVGPLGETASVLRPLIAERGRLALTTVVKVGRTPEGAAVDYWNSRLGEALASPRDALGDVEVAGYEPEMIETISGPDLDEYYNEVEKVLQRAGASGDGPVQLAEEIAVHRSMKGQACVAMAVVIARRKEPGEKPPASRDAG